MEKELWQHLKETDKPIVLYGMGNGADKIINVLNKNGITFSGVFASDGFVRDKFFHGHKITSFSELEQRFGKMIVLLCFGSARTEVLENIHKISARQELYAPDVPVIGDGLFDKNFCIKHKNALEWVYHRLADDLSRKTFENTIKYKLTGKLSYLYGCEASPDEPYESLLKLNNNESFLDLGAYNGDTVADFVSRVPSYRHITAVEPDAKTFKKLMKNTENLSNITCINVGISDFDGIGLFGMRGGRSSGTAYAQTEMEFATVDTLAQENTPTYIKMDIEGEELNAIHGAKNTIADHKPKMLIACYHRNEDIFTIPKAVLDLNDSYRIYMRHFTSVPAWDTNFYFV